MKKRVRNGLITAVIVLGMVAAFSACGSAAGSGAPAEAETPVIQPEEIDGAEEAVIPEAPDNDLAVESDSQQIREDETMSEETKRPALTPPLTIACVGDSITYGYGVSKTRDRDAYPAMLQALLDEAGYVRDDNRVTVLNFGVNGRTLMSTTEKPYQSSDRYDGSLNAAADIYVIMLGTNDAKTFNWNHEVYRSELPVFLKTYMDVQTAAGKPACLIAMLPPRVFPAMGTDKPYEIVDQVIDEEVCPIIAECVDELNDEFGFEAISVIDLYTLTEDSPELFMDGVHPNAQGNAVIADAVFTEISRLVTAD